MAQNEPEELLRRVEAVTASDLALNADILKSLRSYFPNAAAAGLIPDGLVTSLDAILALVVAALPGWHFSLYGQAWSDGGPWHCSIRQSDVLDDDDKLGTGAARTPHFAILAAVLRLASRL